LARIGKLTFLVKTWEKPIFCVWTGHFPLKTEFSGDNWPFPTGNDGFGRKMVFSRRERHFQAANGVFRLRTAFSGCERRFRAENSDFQGRLAMASGGR